MWLRLSFRSRGTHQLTAVVFLAALRKWWATAELAPAAYEIVEVADNCSDNRDVLLLQLSHEAELVDFAEARFSQHLSAPVNKQHLLFSLGEAPRRVTEDIKEYTAIAQVKDQTVRHVNRVAQVKMASMRSISSIYLVMFFPLLMAWAYYWQLESDERWKKQCYLMLLQVTVATTLVGTVLANQSLCLLMMAPMSLTFIQGTAMCIAFGVSGFLQIFCDGKRHRPSIVKGVCTWFPAACVYGVFQMIDHFVSRYTSLSARTVFGNLCPVVGLMLEAALAKVLVPRTADGISSSFSSKMALFGMAFGAGIFALEYPDFTTVGIASCMMEVIARCACRLVQRCLIDKTDGTPVSMLAFLDGLMVSLPAFYLSTRKAGEDLFSSFDFWMRTPSIAILLLLSTMAMSVGHYSCTLLLMESTATNIMVLSNISTGLSIFLGIHFYGDNDFERPIAFVGMAISLAAAMWYSAMQCKGVARYEETFETTGRPDGLKS